MLKQLDFFYYPAIALLAAALCTPDTVHSEEIFPAKPITIVVSLQVGSASDVASRVVAEEMSKKFGVPIVVENMPGAGGVIGAMKLNNAKPDGYTIAALNSGLITQVPNLPSNPRMDIEALVPLSLIAALPSVLVASNTLPANITTLKQLVAYSKQNNGKISYGSVGMGSPQHIAMEMLKFETGADLLHVPYKGGPQAVSDVISGQIQATWIAASVALPFVKSGQLRALAVGGGSRLLDLPDVPTSSEAGVKNFEYVPWVAFYAPPGTPQSVVRVLSRSIQNILEQQPIKEKITSYGLAPIGSTSEELNEKGAKERTLMSKVIKKDLKIR